jgi:hypothetical protein
MTDTISGDMATNLARRRRIYELVQLGLDRHYEVGRDPEQYIGEVAEQVGNALGLCVVDVLKIVETQG